MENSSTSASDLLAGAVCCRAESLELLRRLPADCVDLCYIDPPFNTGAEQRLTRNRAHADPQGEHLGFGGRRFHFEPVSTFSYDDHFDDYHAFLRERLVEIYRVLRPQGSLFLHLDPRESHYAKVILDGIFGRDCFRNEIIWAYDYGGRPKNRWPTKHDTILWYSKDARRYTFHYDAIDRIPYMAPRLVGAEKAARGKTPTDVWWHTIVSTNGKERTGYPTQKPLGVLRRVIQVHSSPGDMVMDCFAGSGTTGVAAAEAGRRFLMADQNPAAVEVMRPRLQEVLAQGQALSTPDLG